MGLASQREVPGALVAIPSVRMLVMKLQKPRFSALLPRVIDGATRWRVVCVCFLLPLAEEQLR